MVGPAADAPEGPDEEWAALEVELSERCLNRRHELTQTTLDDGTVTRCVLIPQGPDLVDLPLSNIGHARRLLAIGFERYSYLAGYDAIWSLENRLIECSIRDLGDLIAPARWLWRRITGQDQEGDDIQAIELTGQGPLADVTIRLGNPSAAFTAMAPRRLPGRSGMSIAITGVGAATHDQALETMVRVADSVFFQLDATTGVALGPVRRRERARMPRRVPHPAASLVFPRCEYNHEPLSLYWYGMSARRLPLLQYHAFYQAIEFFFPVHTAAEATNRIRNILRNPAFRVESDTEIARLISAAGPAINSRQSERSSLKAVLLACLDEQAVRAFLEEDEARCDFIGRKTGISDKLVQLRNLQVDLREQLALRIYDIRCKIVHTKMEDDDEDTYLLPFSASVDELLYDIEILQYVARHVIAASGTALQITPAGREQ
ncbi:hypothetical protein LLH23_00445 [bacterium]|nr:hypothetical protein [bacterium]